MPAKHAILRPGATSGRLTSGLAGGVAGGLLFGALLLTSAVAGATEEETSVGASVVVLLGTTSVVVLWAAHMAFAALLGVVFAFLVPPESMRTGALTGMLYGALLWLATYMLGLRGLTGAPFAFDAAAAYALVGHLAYGLALGLVYVAFHRMEVREALSARSEKWRRWGRRERGESR